jgi:diguanylate cyclase
MPASTTAAPVPSRPVDPDVASDAGRLRSRDRRFVDRIYWMRTMGLGLGFVCVASVFHLHRESWPAWALLAAYAFAWPPMARMLAIRSIVPVRAEHRNLAADSMLGGVWIALMQFNPLPSALILAMLSADKVAVGGVRFAVRTSVGLVVACAATSAMLGFVVDALTPMSVVWACLPFMVAYPLAISHVMYGLANKAAHRNRWLARLSNTDDLTGLANRRQGFIAAEHALAMHRRTGAAAVLVVLDIDMFKDVNDRFGHPAGDEILRQLAVTLQQCSRATDTPIRYAGDEFLLVLPATPLEGAEVLSKRIRELFAELTFAHAPGLRCTISLGAAEAHRDMADVEDWLQQADAALYRAKETGRDRLVTAPRIDTFDRRERVAIEPSLAAPSSRAAA